MLAFSGCNKRHGHPRQEDRQSFRCGVYCCIDVYEKTIWRARCLLGFMPLRELLRDTEYFGAKIFIPFSSMHKYQGQDSAWAQQYSTPLADYAKGWDSKSSEILPAFI